MRQSPPQFNTSVLATKISISLVICLVLAASPFLSFPLWTDTGYHNKQRIIEAFCLSLLLLFLPMRVMSGTYMRLIINKNAAIYLSIFFLLGFFSCVNAYSSRHAFYEWSSFFLLLTLAWVVAMEMHASVDRVLDSVLIVCGLGCAFYLFHVILIYSSAIAVGVQLTVADLTFGFDNYRFFNHTQTISLPLLALLVLRRSGHKGQYWLAFAVTSLWWAMLFVSAGRGTFIGLIGAVAITWFFLRKIAKPWYSVMVCTCLAGFVTYLIFFVLMPILTGLSPFGLAPDVVSRTLAAPTSGRGPLWLIAWQMITEHPLLGGGPLHYAHYSHVVQNGAHPHNWILQLASEWGVPALICMIAAIQIAYRALLLTRQAIAPEDLRNQATLSAWLSVGMAILIDGLVSGLIVMPTSQLWIALYVGCAWGWASSILNTSDMKRSHIRARGLHTMGSIAAVLFFLALFWSGLLPEVLDLSSFEASALNSDAYSRRMFFPRIWSAGYF